MIPVTNMNTSREKELASELRQAQQQLSDLRRQITGLERDNRLLSIMSENADRLRRGSEAEKKLQHLYQSMLLGHCPSMLFIFDEELRLQLATSSCLSILPFNSLDDMLYLGFSDVFGSKMQQEWIDRVEAECAEVMQARRSRDYSECIEFAFESGSMEAQLNLAPIIEEDSAMLKGVLLSITDLTEFSIIKRRSEEYSEQGFNFVERLAQEFSDPLDLIKGCAELLVLGGLPDTQQNYASTIISSSGSLLAGIRNIIDFSSIRDGKAEIIGSEYKLGTLLKDACSMINPQAEEKGLTLITDIDPGLPATLFGDEARLRQILANLLRNALKYTDQGMITLKVQGKREGELLTLEIQVIDTGSGFKHEEIPLLFSEANLAEGGLADGSGLGLVISRGLARLMGGDVAVESVFGQGSIFTLRIPQNVAGKTCLAEVQYPERKKVLLLDNGSASDRLANLLDQLGVPHVNFHDTKEQALPGWEDATHCLYFEGHDESDLGKLRGALPECSFVVVRNLRNARERVKYYDVAVYEPVLVTDLAHAINLNRKPGLGDAAANFAVENALALVADDNELNLAVLSDTLSAYGFEVKQAQNGEEAAKLCENQPFDIIFMDYLMPGLNGLEAAKLVRNSSLNRHTPMLVLTADLVDGMGDYLTGSVFDGIITKPLEMNDIGRAVLAWMPQCKLVKSPRNGSAGGNYSGQPNFDLVGLLDEFGMYANEVMRELNGDIHAFVDRLRQASELLGGMVEKLKRQVGAEDWNNFGKAMSELRKLLHGIGARDCAMRASKMEAAAERGNKEYIHSDFKSLMGNMYMMEKKLEALMPVVNSGSKLDQAVNDPLYIYGRLHDLHVSLESRNLELARDAMEDLARHSFDHSLDLLLNEVRWAMEDLDFEAARKNNSKAMNYYRTSSAVHQAYGQ